ncbi:C-type lectin domain family 10 member A-like isoform X2 [Hypanus sabinus]|uniref:C-type lectin domain family 10 member A-like isoform X2 n=1 Tax=Hypanus sabinus TaxID=79690 RepID=UPI0028C4DBF6|nr:C-type lectin domain family 10 member A-like isoform X2 [Hypanus sabinus]
MRGSKGGSPRGHRQRKDQQAEAYEEESELPDMVMEIEDDVLEEYNESKGTYQDKNQRLAKALALLGLLVCLILLGLMVYFGVTYEKMRRRLRQAGVGLQETTERYLKMQQNARLQEEQYCGHFRNSTQHWLQLFCEKYECPTRICDPGWILFGRSCFLFSNVSQSWEQSGEACIQLQGYLAIISSKKMQKFLLEHRRESIYWIGLTDKVTEGSWVWVDGTKVADGVMLWASGQPDNAFNRTLRMVENCGALSQRGWLDEACARKLPCICEKSAIRLHLVFQRARRG